MKKIAILGSTGSIGTQTLDVVREHSDELQVVALAAGTNKERLKEQIKEFHPKLVSLSDEKKAQEMVDIFQKDMEVCRQITRDYYVARRLKIRIKEQICRLLSPLL